MSWCDTCTNEDGAECVACGGWKHAEPARPAPIGQYVIYRNSSRGFTTAGPFNDEEARAFRARLPDGAGGLGE